MESKETVKEQPHSVEISINAKGNYSGKLKAYSTTLDGAYALATAKATELEILIRSKNKG